MIALGIGIQKMLTDVNYMIPVYLVNIFWLLYNLMAVLISIFVCFEKQRLRTSERFFVHDQMNLRLADGREIPVELIDISMKSSALAPLLPIENADQLVGSEVMLSPASGTLELPGVFFRSRSWGKKLIINFRELSVEQHTHLVNYIFDRQQKGYGNFNEKSIDFGSTITDMVVKWWKMLTQKQ